MLREGGGGGERGGGGGRGKTRKERKRHRREGGGGERERERERYIYAIENRLTSATIGALLLGNYDKRTDRPKDQRTDQ